MRPTRATARQYLGRQAWPPPAPPPLTAALGDSVARFLTTGLAEALEQRLADHRRRGRPGDAAPAHAAPGDAGA